MITKMKQKDNLILIFLIIIAITAYYGISPKAKYPIEVIMLTFFPLTFFFVIQILLLAVENKNAIYKNVINIIKWISVVLYIVYLPIVFFIYAMLTDLTTTPEPDIPSIENYVEYRKKLPWMEYQITHFPTEIPSNATNYYFDIHHSGHKDTFGYLKFNIDKEYIDNFLNNNKNNILRKINFSEIGKYYGFINYYIKLDNKKDYDVYILKKYHFCKDYTSGFIISKSKDEIIYFYADSDLERT